MARSISPFKPYGLPLIALVLSAATLGGCGEDPQADQAVAAQAAADRAEAAAERAEKAAGAVARSTSDDVPVDYGSSADEMEGDGSVANPSGTEGQSRPAGGGPAA